MVGLDAGPPYLCGTGLESSLTYEEIYASVGSGDTRSKNHSLKMV